MLVPIGASTFTQLKLFDRSIAHFKFLLFLVYANNLLSCLEHFKALCPICYVTVIYFSSSSANEIEHFFLNKDSDLPKLFSWFSANRLTLNISKSKFILIGNDVTAIDINSSLESTHVGVTINKAMTWGDHADTISTKINQGLGLLKRILRHLLPLETRT